MRFLKTLLTAILVILILVVVVGLFLPTSYRVERASVIAATPESIHEYVGDLTKWDEWTPWREEDPTIIVTRGEKTSGVGASQSWVGDRGDGALTITRDSPEEGIEYDMVFDGGAYVCESAMVYDTLPNGDTKVTWIMNGNMEMPVIGGYFALVMDSMVGAMFDKGLLNLKKSVEGGVARGSAAS